MKKYKYNKNDDVYFIHTKYIDGGSIKIGDKDFYISTKSFQSVNKGIIYDKLDLRNRTEHIYEIKDNKGFSFCIFEKEIFKNKEKALLYCRKKNKDTCKCMFNELKLLKRII